MKGTHHWAYCGAGVKDYISSLRVPWTTQLKLSKGANEAIKLEFCSVEKIAQLSLPRYSQIHQHEG